MDRGPRQCWARPIAFDMIVLAYRFVNLTLRKDLCEVTFVSTSSASTVVDRARNPSFVSTRFRPHSDCIRPMSRMVVMCPSKDFSIIKVIFGLTGVSRPNGKQCPRQS
jgi:hypothetical protein